MYDYYIALDWAQANMALARMTGKSDKVVVHESQSDLKDLKGYLKSLKGRKVFTLEETSSAQWLYSELRPFVTKLIVCDPYRNRLLSEGVKNDKTDATKLVQLLKANMLKEVYHSGEEFIYLRKLVSGYRDLVQSLVRLKNQRSALFRSVGLNHKKDQFCSKGGLDNFVLSKTNDLIQVKEEIKREYEMKFKCLAKKHKDIRLLQSLPGIGYIHAVQIVASVVNIRRFPEKGHFLSYCGLIKHEKMSGGVSYGKRRPRFYRPLKAVFKMATHSATMSGTSSPLRALCEHYINEKGQSVFVARHNIARRLASLVYSMLKSGQKFNPNRREEKLREKK